MITDDALVVAMLNCASQLAIAIEHAKDRRHAKILERLRNASSWLNGAISVAALETIAEEATP